jgi:hypothetical protein
LIRNLVVSINRYLNISQLSLPEIKSLLTADSPLIRFSSPKGNGGDTNDDGFESILIRDFDPFAKKLKSPLPSLHNPFVFLTNFASAHLTSHVNMTDFSFQIFHSQLYSQLVSLRKQQREAEAETETETEVPSVPIFATVPFTTESSLENLLRRNVILRKIFVEKEMEKKLAGGQGGEERLRSLQFRELDLFQLTAGKLEMEDRIHFTGVPMAMSVVISLNLMCQQANIAAAQSQKRG